MLLQAPSFVRSAIWSKSSLFVLLILTGDCASAVQIQSLTVQQGRIEGQSVEVTARVDFGDKPIVAPGGLSGLPCEPSGDSGGLPFRCEPPSEPATLTSLLKRQTVTRRNVTAQLLTGGASPTLGLVAAPPIQTTLELTSSGTSTTYKGQFPYLPWGNWRVQVTAREEQQDCWFRSSRGFLKCSPSVVTQSVTTSPLFVVGAPQGCFHFQRIGENKSGLDGWTAYGYSADVQNWPPPPTGSLPVRWQNDLGFFSQTNQNGALVHDVDTNAAAGVPGSSFRIDLLSPDLTKRSEWKKVQGLTLRMYNAVMPPEAWLSLRPALRVTQMDGSERFRRQAASVGPPYVEQFFNVWGGLGYHIVTSRFQLEPGDIVKQIVITVYGNTVLDMPAPGTTLFFTLDGVCPVQ